MEVPKSYFQGGGTTNVVAYSVTHGLTGNGYDSERLSVRAINNLPPNKPTVRPDPWMGMSAPTIRGVDNNIVDRKTLAGGLTVQIPPLTVSAGDAVDVTLYLNGYWSTLPTCSRTGLLTTELFPHRVTHDDSINGFEVVFSTPDLMGYSNGTIEVQYRTYKPEKPLSSSKVSVVLKQSLNTD